MITHITSNFIYTIYVSLLREISILNLQNLYFLNYSTALLKNINNTPTVLKTGTIKGSSSLILSLSSFFGRESV